MGKTGSATRRQLVDRATKAERALIQALEQAGEPYQFQYTVRTPEAQTGFYVVDFHLPRRHLLVELDGSRHYTQAGHWRDRLRAEAIQRARPNLQLVRFSNHEATRDPDALARFLQTF